MRLLVADGVLDQFVGHARECLPHEACGFLVGHGESAERFLAAPNVLKSPTAFSVEPQFLFELFRTLRTEGESLVAVCHSHPSGMAIPSPRDIREAHYRDVAHVIVSFADESPVIGAFRIAGAWAVPIELHAIV